MGCVAKGRAMLQGSFKKRVQDQLIAASKRAIERFQFRNQVEGELRGGRQGATHGC
jgi:hypothetical protein